MYVTNLQKLRSLCVTEWYVWYVMYVCYKSTETKRFHVFVFRHPPGFDTPFTGCIRKISIDEHELQFREPDPKLLASADISACAGKPLTHKCQWVDVNTF